MILALSIRLGVIVTEVERLPMYVIREYLAMLKKPDDPPAENAPTELQGDVMAQLDLMRQQRRERE